MNKIKLNAEMKSVQSGKPGLNSAHHISLNNLSSELEVTLDPLISKAVPWHDYMSVKLFIVFVWFSFSLIQSKNTL